LCLSDLPTETSDWVMFRNELTSSWIKVIWGDKSAMLMTNNVSALSIIRGIVLAKALDANLKIDIVPQVDSLGTYQMVEKAIDQFRNQKEALR
jgi:hypothetical protein